MSAFPTLTTPEGASALSDASSRTANDGHMVDYGDDGVARVRVLYQETQWTFNLDLPVLSAAQVTELLDHYAANRLSSFAFVWPEDASVYQCLYLGPPQPRPSTGNASRAYGVTLAGVVAT